jgi:hypothetical protein
MRMDDRSLRVLPPILRDKHYSTPSAFTPESLLREARRQKDVPDTPCAARRNLGLLSQYDGPL